MGKLKKMNLFNKTTNNTNYATWLNNTNYYYYYNMFQSAIMALIDYEDLPSSMHKRAFKMQMLTGWNVLFSDEVMGLINLWAAQAGGLSPWGDPVRIKAYSLYNSYTRTLKYDECVVVYDNLLHKPPMEMIKNYSERLANIDRTIDININAQKTPIMVVGPEEQKLTLENLYNQYQGNAPVIYANKDITLDNLTVLRTDAPFIAPALHDLKVRILGEALSYFGIDNITYQKRERINEKEIEMSSGITRLTREARIQMQQQCLDRFNEMFGQKVRAVPNDDAMLQLERLNLDDFVQERDEKEAKEE